MFLFFFSFFLEPELIIAALDDKGRKLSSLFHLQSEKLIWKSYQRSKCRIRIFVSARNDQLTAFPIHTSDMLVKADSFFSLPLRKIILSEWCSRETSVFMHCEIKIGHITQAFQHSVQPPEIRLRVKAQKLGCCLLRSLLIFVGWWSCVCYTFSVRTFLLILTTSKVCLRVKNWGLYSVCYNQDPSKHFPEV